MSYAAPPEKATVPDRRNLIIDLRCLQDSRYAERGIAAHSRNAVAMARQVCDYAREAWIIGMIDPELEPVPAEIAALVDELSQTPYLPDLPHGTIFLQLSPMQEDQVLIARLLLNPNVKTAALVYDFIPFDHQARYLTDTRQRIDYLTSMVWLKHYDLFLPISADAERRLQQLHPPARGRTLVTGVPLPPWTEHPAAPGTAKHILTVAGDDPRKNPFVLIRAHARSRILQERQVPLIIAGNYSAETRAALLNLAVDAGGAKTLVQVPGKVADAVLHGFYRDALCVVTASRAEGFSLPVIEAMAAGVPSVVSDIAVHAALVEDAALRFDPDDNVKLTTILDRIADDTAHRAQIIAAQADVWPQFAARAVATRIWGAIETLLAPPRVFSPRRARVAMLTPLPPARSGVANYSAALAARLERRVELTLYSSSIGGNAGPVSGVPHLSPRFDRVISVMGNSTDHHAIYDLAVRYGSACICHDARLLGLATTRFGLIRAAQMAAKELGRAVSETELLDWAHNEQLREADFLGDLAASSRPLIFHTARTVREVKNRFGREAVFLPFAVYLPEITGPIDTAAQRRAREKLGLPVDEKIICSFGGIDPIKGVEPALRAMAMLRRDGVKCRLIWVGEGESQRPRFAALAASLGLGGQVHFNRDYVSAEIFRDYLLAADAGLQLRVGRPGNISGALQDCIAAGLPSVASEDLAENLQAPAYVFRVSDRLNPAEIAAALTNVLGRAEPRGAHEDARAAYCEAHSMERYAASLCEILDLSA